MSPINRKSFSWSLGCKMLNHKRQAGAMARTMTQFRSFWRCMCQDIWLLDFKVEAQVKRTWYLDTQAEQMGRYEEKPAELCVGVFRGERTSTNIWPLCWPLASAQPRVYLPVLVDTECHVSSMSQETRKHVRKFTSLLSHPQELPGLVVLFLSHVTLSSVTETAWSFITCALDSARSQMLRPHLPLCSESKVHILCELCMKGMLILNSTHLYVHMLYVHKTHIEQWRKMCKICSEDYIKRFLSNNFIIISSYTYILIMHKYIENQADL